MHLELAENLEELTFEKGYNLNTKSLLVDLLVIKKETPILIKNEIGAIFRKYNIMEYKSLRDKEFMEVIMKYYKKAKEIMDMDVTEFVGGVPENEIENAMEALSVIFPESYKAFLADFGGGDAGGEIIFGITNNEEDDVVIATQMERSQGLPEKLIIIGFWDDTLVCLDTEKMNNGECPVVEVNDDYSEAEIVADTFGKFLYEYLNEE